MAVDLIVYSGSVTGNLVPGGKVSGNVTLKNQGNTTSSGFYTRYYLSTNNIITTFDTYMGYDYISSLGSNRTTSRSYSFNLPSNLKSGQTYYVGAIADYNNRVSESNEGNNTLARSITIGDGATDVDLVISSGGISGTVQAGSYITASATVKNEGKSTARSSYLGYYMSTDSNITSRDTRLSRDYVASLTSGRYSKESDRIKLPGSFDPTKHYIGVLADYAGYVKESSETNNTRILYTPTKEISLFEKIGYAAGAAIQKGISGLSDLTSYTYDGIKNILTSEYQKGRKYLGFISAELGLDDLLAVIAAAPSGGASALAAALIDLGPKGEVSVYFDLADVFSVTKEGSGGYSGNSKGRITTYLDVGGTLTKVALGSGGWPVDAGFVRVEMEEDAQDLTRSWSFDFVDSNLFGFGFSLGTDGLDFTHPLKALSFGSIGGGISIGDLQVNVFRGEFGKENLLTAVTANAVPPGMTSLLAITNVIKLPAVTEFTATDGISGTGKSDTLYGTSGNDVVDGDSGNDRLYGNNGNDIMIGGKGDDFLNGGYGNDLYRFYRDGGNDIIDESGAGSSADILSIYEKNNWVDLNFYNFDSFDDLKFKKVGNDLQISLEVKGWPIGLDRNEGSIIIKNQGSSGSRIEILKIHNDNGKQIGGDISLASVWSATNTSLSTLNLTNKIDSNGWLTVTA
jgi:hypothetical protein